MGPAPRDGPLESAMAVRGGERARPALRAWSGPWGWWRPLQVSQFRNLGSVWRGLTNHTDKPGFSPRAAPLPPGPSGLEGGQARLVLPCTQALCLGVSQLSGSLCDRRAPHATPPTPCRAIRNIPVVGGEEI